MAASEQTVLLANVVSICGVLVLAAGIILYICCVHRKSRRGKNRRNIHGGDNRESSYCHASKYHAPSILNASRHPVKRNLYDLHQVVFIRSQKWRAARNLLGILKGPPASLHALNLVTGMWVSNVFSFPIGSTVFMAPLTIAPLRTDLFDSLCPIRLKYHRRHSSVPTFRLLASTSNAVPTSQ